MNRGDRQQPTGPRPVRRSTMPPKPSLPEGERPHIPREVYRELKTSAKAGVLDDAARAFGAAIEALDAGDTARARTLLDWVKHVASRSAAVREALGIVAYQEGDFATAHSELLTYRRLSGRADQNHLLADCARAAGRHEKVLEYVREMRRPEIPRDRQVEGLIVLAGDRADRGDLRGALAVLEEAGLKPVKVEVWHPRLWYAAGDLAERMGDRALARDYFEAILAIDEDFLDAADRLAALA